MSDAPIAPRERHPALTKFGHQPFVNGCEPVTSGDSVGAIHPSAPRDAHPVESPRPLIKALAWDIGLNATIPLASYYLCKRFVSPSELTALIGATSFPILKSVHDVVRRRELDPVAVLVLLGIATSIVALFLGGDPRILLIRESLITGAFGLSCLVSLVFPRPLMFYFGRPFMTGGDPQRRRAYDQRWGNPAVRRAHRLITAVWGLVFTGEFVVRVVLVYSLPSAAVLAVSPFLTGAATIGTIVWTFRYAFKLRARLSSATVA